MDALATWAMLAAIILAVLWFVYEHATSGGDDGGAS